MNCGLTPASQRSPFHATSISMAGMLLCVFMTLAVLVSVSTDQTGASLADVTSSFSGSMRDHGRNDVAVIAAAFRQAAVVSDDNRSDRPRGGLNVRGHNDRSDVSTATSDEEDAEQSSGEPYHRVDANSAIFFNLMMELQRYCKVSPAKEFCGQLALDLHSQISQSEDSVETAVERLIRTCRQSTALVHQSCAEFEVIVWASTPAAEALAVASEEAFGLEKSLERSLKTQAGAAITISSSGRIWPLPQSPRPLVTVVVRTTKREGTRLAAINGAQ